MTILKVTHTEQEQLELGILYTLVQHSAYGYAQDPQFEKAVEERYIRNNQKLKAIKKRGGFILVGYFDAYGKAEEENYPPEVKGLIPCARGTFDAYLVDGLKLYIPGKTDVENSDPRQSIKLNDGRSFNTGNGRILRL